MASPAENFEVSQPTSLHESVGDDPSATLKQGFVDGGVLISFTGSISETHQSDVLNSLLFAQLAADNKYDRYQDAELWYKFFSSVLLKIGWVIGEFNFQRYEQHTKIPMMIVQTLRSKLTSTEVGVLQSTLDSLKSSENKSSFHILSTDSLGPSKHGRNFQVSLAKEDTNGQVMMYMASFYFEEKVAHSRWFWSKHDFKEISCFKNAQVVSLNEDVYSVVRQEIVDKLREEGKKREFVSEMKF